MKPTHYIFGANIQQHEIHLMVQATKVTLTDAKGHRLQNMKKWSYLVNYQTRRHYDYA